jgi:CNT family concentrative nucleoside transporter
LFVLKSGAGYSLFKWIATAASDFLANGLVGAAFFWDQETVDTKHWFFVNTLSTIIFFVAFVQVRFSRFDLVDEPLIQ